MGELRLYNAEQKAGEAEEEFVKCCGEYTAFIKKVLSGGRRHAWLGGVADRRWSGVVTMTRLVTKTPTVPGYCSSV